MPVAESESGKTVVRVEHTAAAEADDQAAAHTSGGTTFAPSPEAKRKALTFRIIAIVLWVVAIAAEAFAIFWVLKQNPVNMILLIGLIVVMAALSVVGNILWKRSNQADPASRDDKVRFFVQNQLGAIIAVVAFLPLVILVLANKNMSGGQKAVAAIIAIVALGAGVATGVSVNPPSTQQYDSETAAVVQLTGHDLVYWTKSGKVYHLCEDASAVNQTSKDNTIYSGTVGDAHGAGKTRLTKQVDQEEAQCGFTPKDASPSATP
jgi:hypothetical protein